MITRNGPSLWESTEGLRLGLGLALLVVIIVGLTIYLLSSRGSTQIMHGFARRSALDPDTEPAQSARLKLRRRWLISALFGLIPLGLLVWEWLDAGAERFPKLLGYVFLAVLAVGVGRTVAVLTEQPKPNPEIPVVEREPRPAVPDYVSPAELQVARVAPILSLAAALVVGVLQTTEVLPGTAAVTLGFGLLPVLVFLCVGQVAKRIAARPQREKTNMHLLWDDALRADALQNLFQVVPATAAYVLLQIAVSVPETGGETEYFALYAATAGVVIVLWFVSLIWISHTEPGRHYLRRLWTRLSN